MTRLNVIALTCALLITSTNAEARMDCGRTQRAYFHIADRSLNLALEWARKFRHVAAQPGAVVVQRRHGRALGGGPGGHVSRIVRNTGHCRAVVSDNAGTYERDICRNLVAYVMP